MALRQLLENIVARHWDSGAPAEGSGFPRVKWLQQLVDLINRPVINRLTASTNNTVVNANGAVQSSGVGTGLMQPKRYAEFTVKARISFNLTGGGNGGGGGTSIQLQTNGVNNGSQSKLNLQAGANVTITDNGTGTDTIAAADPAAADAIDAVGSFFWSNGQMGHIPDAGNSGNAQPFNSANQLMCMRMYLAKATRVSKITITSSGSGSSDVNAGLYDDNGNLVLDSGSFAIGTAGGVAKQFVNTITPVTVPPGWYWFTVAGAATGGSATCLIFAPIGAVTQPAAMFFKNNTGAQIKIATAANARAGGVLPATLGALTASAFTQIMMALFEQ